MRTKFSYVFCSTKRLLWKTFGMRDELLDVLLSQARKIMLFTGIDARNVTKVFLSKGAPVLTFTEHNNSSFKKMFSDLLKVSLFLQVLPLNISSQCFLGESACETKKNRKKMYFRKVPNYAHTHIHTPKNIINV